MQPPPDDPDDPVRRRDAEARAAAEAEVERILALPSLAERIRAYAGLARRLAEGGHAMPPGAEERAVQPFRAALGGASHPAAATGLDAHRAFREREHEHTGWSSRAAGGVAGHPAPGADAGAADREPRRASRERGSAPAARLHVPRTVALGAILLATALPFLVAIAKQIAAPEGGAVFASLRSRVAGFALALACAGILAALASRTTTRVGLAWLVAGAFVGGTAGLAVARGLVGP